MPETIIQATIPQSLSLSTVFTRSAQRCTVCDGQLLGEQNQDYEPYLNLQCYVRSANMADDINE